MRFSTYHQPRQRRGFTLFELLVVTAILVRGIVTLAPLFFCNRDESPRQGNCMSNIKGLIQGLKMYRDDHAVCPDALYGISYDGVTLETRLYPEFVKEKITFVCSKSPVWPLESPVLVPAINQSDGSVALVPAFSSYDAQLRNPDSPRAMYELHYSRRWSDEQPEFTDRQLSAGEPSDDTVVTWCLYHAELDRRSGTVKPGRCAIVGFWDGRVQKLPVERLSDWPDEAGRYPWQVIPKP